MLELDGSEGGGQLVRTALSLSVLAGEPFRMEGIRGSRPNPGLRPQHLAAVELLADVGDARVSGAVEGSRTLTFEPRDVVAGTYEVDIGTAGSVTLLFDAVLPLVTALEDHLSVRAAGGTDVRWAPTMDYFRRVKLTLLRRHGVGVSVDLDRRGFYPAGGGVATLRVAPGTLDAFDLSERGGGIGARVYSTATADLADSDVAERQAETAAECLGSDDVDVFERTIQYSRSRSTGSVVAIRLDYEEAVAGFDRLGERGTPAETVADEAVDRARSFHASTAAVDVNMADQLLVFLGIGGGEIAVPDLTDHVGTNLALLDRFGYEVSVDRSGRTPILSASGRP